MSEDRSMHVHTDGWMDGRRMMDGGWLDGWRLGGWMDGG